MMENSDLEQIRNNVVVSRECPKASSYIYNYSIINSNLDNESKVIIAKKIFKEFMTNKISNLFLSKGITNIIIFNIVNEAIASIGIGTILDKKIFESLIVNEFYCLTLEPLINRTFKDDKEISTYMDNIKKECEYITTSIFNILNI